MVSHLNTCHGLAADYLASKFSERNTSYNLRDSENNECWIAARTNYFKYSFSYSGATLWNRLPLEATIGARNPSGRLNAKSAKLYKARHFSFYLFVLADELPVVK